MATVFEFKQRKEYCEHTELLIDEKLRTLECKRCGSVLEAFDWLLEQAYREKSCFEQLRSLRKEVVDKREEIWQLKSEEKKLKSSIRRNKLNR